MNDSELPVVVVGSGAMGALHARLWTAEAGFRVAALVDPDRERAEAVAAAQKIDAVFADYREALAQVKPAVVSVCIPTYLHAPVTVAALNQGCHVLCEKPIALTLAGAEAMIKKANSSGLQLGIGFMRRFSPIRPVLTDWFHTGAYPGPRLYSAQTALPVRPKIAMHDVLANGGPLIDMMCHFVDTARWLFRSEPVAVAAQGMTIATDRPELATIEQKAVDTATVLIRFASGDLLSCQLCWGLPPGSKPQSGLAEWVYGPAGVLELRLHGNSQYAIHHAEDGLKTTVAEAEALMYAHEVSQFGRAVRDQGTFAARGEDGLAALRVSLAALESIKTGESVAIAP